MGANPNYQPLPTTQTTQPSGPQNFQPQPTTQTAQPQGTDPFADQRDEADMYALLARKPELMAENRYKLSIPQVSRGVSFNPATGMPMAGFVDNVPVRFVNGRPQVIPSDIPQAVADRAGAVASAQAKARFPFAEVTTGSGARMPAFMAGAAPNPFTTTNPSPSPASSVPPAVAAAAASGKPFEATQTPDGAVTVNPAPQGNDPWSTMPRLAQPGGVGQTTYQSGVAKAQGDAVNRLVEKYGQKADAAQFRIATNAQAKDMLSRADTGTGAAFMGDIKTFLVSRAGIPESDFKNDPAATAALNKDLMTAAVAKAKSMYGTRMTQNEVNNMLKRGAPNGDMLKAAISFLIDSDSESAKYDVQQANDLGEYISRGGDPLRFEGWYAKTFPLSAAVEKVQLAPNTPENASASGYGWSAKRIN